jgi:hypothetical protein
MAGITWPDLANDQTPSAEPIVCHSLSTTCRLFLQSFSSYSPLVLRSVVRWFSRLAGYSPQ